MSEEKIAVSIKNLSCVFNPKLENEILALNNISFDFPEKKIHFIIGNSGSGKSTLVAHFNGLLKSKIGSLQINDISIPGKTKKIKNPKILRREISMVFQFPEYQLFKDTVINDVSFGPKVLKIPVEKSREKNISLIQDEIKTNFNQYINLFKKKSPEILNIDCDEFLSKLKIQFSVKKIGKTKKAKLCYNSACVVQSFEKINFSTPAYYQYEVSKQNLNKLGIRDSFFERSPFGLSGGQKRRVAISGILSIDPSILVFDEPTAGLDPAGEKEMLQIILDAKESGKTIFVISHNMDHVLEIADTVTVMDKGEIIAHGEPYEIFLNDELIQKCNIELPKIIDFILSLAKNNKKYECLLQEKHNTIESLAKSLSKSYKGK